MYDKFDDGGTRLSLQQIRDIITPIAVQIGADLRLLPSFDPSDDFSTSNIDVDVAYHWIGRERGKVLTWKSTRSLDELLYLVFSSLTFSVAGADAAATPRDGRDFRRSLFARQLELIGSIRPPWRDRLLGEINDVLARYPFHDDGQATFDG